eukprot:CAMPEP_0194305462 /NCGR_PEP_ID=MMETSP0171-20130528/2900_1 /TAXON_ID=218684 /ORGANISM="Corethron pennatum, Strain L29A3" /LENGTH=155 /DNA_ID=CAMNT_0039057003 /DNA_START=36 /DNA_END=500 /DNA_ORIENTATION=-
MIIVVLSLSAPPPKIYLSYHLVGVLTAPLSPVPPPVLPQPPVERHFRMFGRRRPVRHPSLRLFDLPPAVVDQVEGEQRLGAEEQLPAGRRAVDRPSEPDELPVEAAVGRGGRRAAHTLSVVVCVAGGRSVEIGVGLYLYSAVAERSCGGRLFVEE